MDEKELRAILRALDHAEGRLRTLDAMQHQDIPRNDDVIRTIRSVAEPLRDALASPSATESDRQQSRINAERLSVQYAARTESTPEAIARCAYRAGYGAGSSDAATATGRTPSEMQSMLSRSLSLTRRAQSRLALLIEAYVANGLRQSLGKTEADLHAEVDYVLGVAPFMVTGDMRNEINRVLDIAKTSAVGAEKAVLSASVEGQADPQTLDGWTNERCQYDVCDEAEKHDPKCVAWKDGSSPTSGGARG